MEWSLRKCDLGKGEFMYMPTTVKTPPCSRDLLFPEFTFRVPRLLRWLQGLHVPTPAPRYALTVQ